jgi:hypothetical protein
MSTSFSGAAGPDESRMDTKSQLEIVAAEDVTLIHLAQELDEHTNKLRKSVLDAVRQMRGKITTQATDMIDAERGRSRDFERRLLSQIDGLQRLLDQRTKELESERNLSERLVLQRQAQVRRRRVQALAKEGLRRWHEFVQDQKRRERLCAFLSKTRRERIARQTFNSWRHEIQRQKHAATIELVTGEHRRATARLQSEHQTTENASKLEMIAMRENLSKEEERRAILEERLKAAFMRGVCALNMEAMQVLRSAPQDGDVSVASLLQAMNLTSSTLDSEKVEPASTDRLMRQQEALQAQILEMQQQFTHAAQGAVVPQQETHGDRPRSASAARPRTGEPAVRVTMHQRANLNADRRPKVLVEAPPRPGWRGF